MGDRPLFDVEATAARPASGLARLADGIGRAASWLFLAAIAISGYEVVMRYAFGSPSAWAHVTVTTLCALGFAVGGAYAMARGEHIRISVLADRASPGTGRVLTIVGLLVGLLYLGGLAWGFWILAQESVWRFGAAGDWRPELTPGPPNWPLPSLMKAVLLAATLLFALVVIERLAAVMRRRD